MRHWCLIAGAAVAACGQSQTMRTNAGRPAVVVTGSATTIRGLDSVRFVAQVRPDIAAKMQDPGVADTLVPHVVGWIWIQDLDIIDPWTKACRAADTVCTTLVHGSGTMVFSLRLRDQICAGWAHVEVLSIPDIDLERDNPTARSRDDSISLAMTTKTASWRPCTA